MERGNYRANKRADDRRKVAAATSTVKDTDGAGPRLTAKVFQNRSKAERMMGSGAGALSGKNGAGKRVFK